MKELEKSIINDLQELGSFLLDFDQDDDWLEVAKLLKERASQIENFTLQERNNDEKAR